MDMSVPYVSVGRGLGEFPSDGSAKLFVVANGLQELSLTQFEYTVWGQLHRFYTLADWETAILQKLKNSPNFNYHKVLQGMLDRHLLKPWSFSSIQDQNLISLHATRYGYAYGMTNQKWLISDSNAQKSYELTQDQYDVWNAAAGKVMLLEVVDTLMDQRNIELDEAFDLLVKHGLDLYRLSLWGLDYVDVDQLGVQV